MYHNKKVSVVIPTYNEAGSIRATIDGFFATGLADEVVVVDNNALGNTAEEIKKTKAVHIEEKEHQGYGHAIMRGLREAKGDLIIITEGDGTFRPEDIEKLLAYSGEFDVVFGTRNSRDTMWDGAFMPFPVSIGNWLWAKWIEILFNGPVLTDVGCTYKLMSRKALDKVVDLFPLSKGDGTFNPELMIWCLKRKLTTIEIPVIYKERVGKSMYTGSILRAAKLGAKMIPVIIRYIFTKVR
jgi:glycosyltransferase involved in cell wall biosynthesis